MASPNHNDPLKRALAQAESLERQQRFTDAIAIYQDLLARIPGDKLVKKRLKAAQAQAARASGGRPGDAELAGLVNLFNGGQLTAALGEGLALRRRYPGFAPLANMLGVIYVRLGRMDEALGAYEQALALNPDYPEVHNNIGNAMARMERVDEAIKHYRHALTLNPNYAEACNGLGNMLHESGELEAAEQSYKQALAIQPRYAEAANNLGNLYKDSGRPDQAVAQFNLALQVAPNFPQAHCNLGNCLRALGRPAEAETCFRQALSLAPDYAEAHMGLGSALGEQGCHAQAVGEFEQALSIKPGLAAAWSAMGNALSDLGRHEQAMAAYRKALEIKPAFAEVYSNMGNALAEIGKYKEAISSFRKALVLKPDFGEAHNNLARIKQFEPGDAQITVLEERMALPGLRSEERMHLSFALGKAYDDLGEIDKAFSHLSRGNELRKSFIGYDIKQERDLFEIIKTVYRNTSVGAGEPGTRSLRPIFIVGLPRSGTSLTEQILASHSQVFGAGELQVAGQYLSPVVRRKGTGNGLDAQDIVMLQKRYLENAASLGFSEPVMTDKMPANFRWIGMLKQAFPDAKFINLVRDPVACCWSMFRIQFFGNGFTNDLRDLGLYYHLYRNLMDFWRSELPADIHDLDYEALTNDQEQEIRKLLEFCDLPFEPSCLEFYKTERAVRTPSNRQVRQQIYTGSSQAWRNYEQHLQPLLDIIANDQALELI